MVSSGSTIDSLEIVYWDTSSTDILNATDVSFGVRPSATTLASTRAPPIPIPYLGVNPFGFDLYDAVISTPGMAGGSGWVNSGQRLHHILWLHIPAASRFSGT